MPTRTQGSRIAQVQFHGSTGSPPTAIDSGRECGDSAPRLREKLKPFLNDLGKRWIRQRLMQQDLSVPLYDPLRYFFRSSRSRRPRVLLTGSIIRCQVFYDCSAGQTHATNICVPAHANDDGVWDALMLTSPCQALNRFACRRIDTGFYQGGFGRPEFQPVPITPFPV